MNTIFMMKIIKRSKIISDLFNLVFLNHILKQPKDYINKIQVAMKI